MIAHVLDGLRSLGPGRSDRRFQSTEDQPYPTGDRPSTSPGTRCAFLSAYPIADVPVQGGSTGPEGRSDMGCEYLLAGRLRVGQCWWR